MRRTTSLAMLAVLAVACPPAAHAGPPKQIVDPRGDWDLPSQDLVMARVYSLLVAKKPQLRADIQLDQPPAQGVATVYKFRFSVGCVTYVFQYVWPEVAGTQRATFEKNDYCGGTRKATPFPATFALTGTTLSMLTPYVGGVRRGMKAIALHAEACPGSCGDTGADPLVGDEGFSRKTYVVGNELPRK